MSPAEGTADVALDAKLSAVFSEPVASDSVKLLLTQGSTSLQGATSLNPGRTVATFTPSGTLPEKASLVFSVAAGFKDDAGNEGAAAKASFTTRVLPLELLSTSPTDQASNVLVTATVSAVFSKPLDPSSINSDTFSLQQGTSAVNSTVTYDASTRTATLTSSAPLLEGRQYAATLSPGIKDTLGVALAAAKTWSFTVAADVPTVVSTAPVDQAQNVPLSASLSAVFSEAMDAATIDSNTFFLKDGSNPLSASVSYAEASKTAALTPGAVLIEGRTYTATITSAVKDRSGVPLAAAKVWNFTTLTTVPSVSGVSPANSAINVPGNALVEVTFSEAMDPATVTDPAVFRVLNGANALAGTRRWDAPSRKAVFQPDAAYPGGATITVNVTTGAKDASGIALASSFNSSFSVSAAPAVASSSPSPNDVGVALNASVTLNFSTTMDLTTLTAANVWVEDSAANPVASSYLPTATSLTISPSSALNESEVYTAVVTTRVKSSAGVPFAAEYRFSFATVGIPPVVSSVSPADGAADVPVGTKIRLVFNEDMDTSTFIGANFRLSDGAANVAGSVAVVGPRTVELTPSAPLLERSSYTVVGGVGLKDAAGNGLASELRSSFTTEPLPRLTALTPAPGAFNVPLSSAIILAANKDLDPASVTITPAGGTPANTFTLWEGTTRIEGTVSYDASSRTIRVIRSSGGAPINWSSGKRYLLELDGTKLKDLNGNPLGGHRITTFVAGSAADGSGPSFVASSPQSGETGVSRLAQPHADFDEPLDQSTVNSTNVKLFDGVNSISGRIDYLPSLRRIVFVPSQPLPAGKSLNLLIGVGIKDMSGNLRQGAANNIGFTTVANSPPSLVRMVPANGASGVPVNTAIRLDLSESVNPSTLAIEVKDGSTLLAGAVSYEAASRSALFRPAANLPLAKTLTVTIKAGLEDSEGLATGAEIVTSFTTNTGANDLGKPSVSSSSPANSATGVAARPNLVLALSEPVDPATIVVDNFTLQEQGGAKVPFGLRYELVNERAILAPSVALGAGKTYEVLVGGGVKDLAGNALDSQAASSRLTFTIDGASPSIAVRQPAQGSTVGNAINVQLTFSEEMNPSTLDADSFTLSFGAGKLMAAVWYDASSRIAYLQPAVALADGAHTVALDASRVSDLAGNKLGSSYSFTVSSAGPSVVGTPTPCGSTVDVDDFGNQLVTITFDRGVKKSGGGPLDSAALKLKLGGVEQSITVTHTAGQAVATLLASGSSTPLAGGSTYELVATTLVVDDATNAPMSSQYGCSFKTQTVVFRDPVDDTNSSGYTVGAAQGGNRWQRLNSVDDSAPPLPTAHNSIVWRGGNSTDGNNYQRDCQLVGAQDRVIYVEKQIDLTGLGEADLRFDEWHDVNDSAGDYGRVCLGSSCSTVLYEIKGTGSSYASKGKGENKLGPYVNSTVVLRFELYIKGYNGVSCGSSPAGKKGLFIDNIQVVGK